MLRFCFNLFLLVWLSFLIAAAIQSHRQPDWSGIHVYDRSQKKAPPPDLMERMEQAIYRRNAPITLTEEEINGYLHHTLQGKAIAPLAPHLTIQSVLLDLEPGKARVCLRWRVAGRWDSTATLAFSITRVGAEYVIEPQSGSYGRLQTPRGFMGVLIPTLTRLSQTLEHEIHTVFQMNKIQIEKDKLVLDPRLDATP